MELEKVKIEKFKKVKTADIPLGRLNILVGANGSGKSSIIQAIHLASCLIRQADRIAADKTATIGVNDLDYLPSNHYAELGNGSKWGNLAGSPSSKVTFSFKSELGEEHTAYGEFRSARNAGISISGAIPNNLSTLMRSKNRFFSAYIPGISGIPNHEQKQSKRVVMKACSYGDSNVYLRNALDLLRVDPANLGKIETWMSAIVGPVSIVVAHKNDTDLYISCRVTIGGRTHPIELISAGYLQLLQIFCYILLFRPKVLLIDEPDIHLHPNVQEKLGPLLADVAQQMNMKVLLTTHSPFVVRGAPLDAKIYWVDDGEITNGSRRAAELTLGWGAFGKKIILISEDAETGLLRKLVSQWPEVEKLVTFFPGLGYKSLATPTQAKELAASLGGKYKIIVHRDRDSLTDEEVEMIRASYADCGIYAWITDFSDVESYFCQPEFISEFSACSIDDARAHIDGVLAQQAQPIADNFASQRRAHNDELYNKTGGSPTNDAVWAGFQGRFLRGAKGKLVFKQLKNRIPGNVFRDEKILQHSIQFELAPSLKELVRSILEGGNEVWNPGENVIQPEGQGAAQ